VVLASLDEAAASPGGRRGARGRARRDGRRRVGERARRALARTGRNAARGGRPRPRSSSGRDDARGGVDQPVGEPSRLPSPALIAAMMMPAKVTMPRARMKVSLKKRYRKYARTRSSNA